MRFTLLASLGLALAAAPGIADAQQTGQRGQPPDTAAGRQQTPRPGAQDTTRAGQVREEARGEVARTANRGLTEAQVRELQQRLRAAGCDPGAVDGMIGPRTRQALACARRQQGIESTNANEVLRALGLEFGFEDSVAVAAGAPAARGAPDYGDPTFVRDTGVVVIDTDTLPAGMLDTTSVFVPVYVIGRASYLRETSLERRRGVLVPRDSAAARDVAPPVRRDTAVRADSAAMRRDTMPAMMRDTMPTMMRDTMSVILRDTIPAMRRDSVPAIRRDSVPALRRDPTPAVRRDTVPAARRDSTPTPRARADTARTDSMRAVRRDTARVVDPLELQRLRDSLLLTLPPRADTLQRADSTARDTTRARRDSTRIPPDTTRRRPPPTP